MNSRSYLAALSLLGPAVTFTVHAEVYMSPEQAVATLFPGTKLSKTSVELTPEQTSRIESQSHQDVRNKSLSTWTDAEGNTVYIDQVLGKHEFITIAVGILPSGKVKGVEILEYRETYGKEVRQASWRQQFVDKDVSSPLTLTKDIKNISGATLSSLHVTNGVRRLVVTYHVLHTPS
jgi:Na+-translocating ferredoxin:NAD+ oxidoreductase RnfG subunit